MTLPVSSGFGWRVNPVTGQLQHHDGIDIPAPVGTPVVASRGGTVIRVDRAGEGKGVINGNAVLIAGQGITWAYLHLDSVAVVPGEVVRQGARIGTVGRTGRATGPHLHLQTLWNGRPTDPRGFFSPDTFRS